MKIAVLSDIHGNHPALEAVLDEAGRLGIERFFVLGDIVGYYYHPDRVMGMLGGLNVDMVQGNHEGMLMAAIEDPAKAEEIRARYGSGIEMAIEKLSREQKEMLAGLPSRKRVDVAGVGFELCHGSPWDRDFYVYPDAETGLLDRCLVDGADFVLLGHTHRPFVYSKGGVTVVNAGSVGQPRDMGGAAGWAVVNTALRTARLIRTPYDISGLVSEVREVDPGLPYLHEVLVRGC